MNGSRAAPAAALVLCLLLPLGLWSAANRPPPESAREDQANRPPSIFDGGDVYTDGRWFLLPDGRLADLSDGRVYRTALEFAPFERIEAEPDRLLVDGSPVKVYQTKLYPELGRMNGEYGILKERFPDAAIAAVSNLHLAAVLSGCLYTFTDGGTMSAVRVDWELRGGMALFEQICLLYESPGEVSGDSRHYIFDGGAIRCFNTTFGELDTF
jgi:hypothetical protein